MTDLKDLARREWQPIETAPRDGTWVLCWGPDCEHGIAWFPPNPCWAEYPEYTHWMPLPEPPEALIARSEA